MIRCTGTKIRALFVCLGAALAFLCVCQPVFADLGADLGALTSFAPRTTGSPGAAAAADYMERRFREIGLADIARQQYLTPVRRHLGTRMLLDNGRQVPVAPLELNSVSPCAVPRPGISGPVVAVGSGELSAMNGLPIQGAIVLMRLDSGRNWLNAVTLGAKAVLYVDQDQGTKFQYRDKFELTPIDFPRFVLSAQQADEFFPDWRAPGVVGRVAGLTSAIRWQRVHADNIYGFIPGSDPELKDELLVVEGFYDAKAFAYGNAPGADEAASAAALLHLAERLKANPPGRSVLLAATSGHAQGAAGWREFLWAARTKGKFLREEMRRQRNRAREAREVLAALDADDLLAYFGPKNAPAVVAAFTAEFRNEVESISTQLMRLRLGTKTANSEDLQGLTAQRMQLRSLTFALAERAPSPQELELVRRFIPRIRATQQGILDDAEAQLTCLKSARDLRGNMAVREVAATVSLHISSRGSGLGAFRNRGFTYDIRPDRNYSGAFTAIATALDEIKNNLAPAAGRAEGPELVNALRPSRLKPWQSWLPDSPSLGGEYASLANYVGISLATVNDLRPYWGTPHDTLENVDLGNLQAQTRLLEDVVLGLTRHGRTLHDEKPRLGFATLDGRSVLLRQGELFADQPARNVLVQCYQGDGIYYSLSDTAGQFRIPGLGSKKVIVGKAVLEAYRFDPESGRVTLAVDKRGTGKDAYRVKMNRLIQETRLQMFPAVQLTATSLLEPRTFDYMTKISLFDARRDTEPNRFWYSRIDTRDSTLLSFFMDPDVPLKFTLSDSVLTRKMLLTGAGDSDQPGQGYATGDWNVLPATELLAAKDMWNLLTPRIDNLEEHGVVNQRVRELEAEGKGKLTQAESALQNRLYDEAMEAARASFALAGRVYNDVSATQKDVLLGVLFYIALFVPFAYCVERVVFACADIKHRIVAFLGVLLSTILVVYQVHPAFRLTYSPAVVILAFFILGLSLLVSGIIFMRFEREMQQLTRRAKGSGGEVGLWKAFGAAFVIGVSNLRRRKLRTGLTVLTLVILTFTIMSFTAVKSVRREAAAPFKDTAPYAGLLLRKLDWSSLPQEALNIVAGAFSGQALVAPRVWLEGPDRTTAPFVDVSGNGRQAEARGLVGLSPVEPRVTGLNQTLVSGRWFEPEQDRAVLLPSRLATRLNAAPGGTVRLWSMDFTVSGIFDEDAFDQALDLDGEPLTPVTFPSAAVLGVAELEAGDAEGGEALQQVQSRYEHVRAGQTLILPARTLLSLGGKLQGMALKPQTPAQVRPLATKLTDRFGLTLFAGIPPAGAEPGGSFVFHASDSLDYAGLPTIVVPVALAMLIVLNTMIASVHERRREIAVYTSLGMAPTHVSFLFIAEAVAFAVVSVVLGYLLAQVAAAVLAGTPLWAGMTANYSSLAGVAAMILVMAVVLLSVIYPSRVAAAIAIPDVNRSWTMPEAQGGTLAVTLPFLLKFDEQLCVGGYLLDYYRSHEDVSHGRFTAKDVRATLACPAPWILDAHPDAPLNPKDPGDCLQLDFNAWLAPFDFGVAQSVNMTFCSSSIAPEFLEIRVTLIREAGEAKAWERLNKGFLNDLRKQLLIWRSLETEPRTAYEQELAHLKQDLDKLQPAQNHAAAGEATGGART